MHRLFHRLTARFLGLTLLLAVPTVALTASSEEVSSARPAEYMIYQYPDVDLVVKVDAPETEFDVQIFGPENALIKDSGVPNRRIGPVFQYVDAAGISRQLMIKVNPGRKIDRSEISLELIQLSLSDRSSQALSKAYRLFSQGTERIHDNATTSWATKAYSLSSAAQVFAGLGMTEMRLWSEYYAAHIVLHQLKDIQTAIEFTSALLPAARVAGFEMLEMAALVLDSEARMQAAAASPRARAQQRYAGTHEVLERRAELAVQLNLKSEQGRALFSDGIAYERQGDLDRAIKRYQQALDATVSAGNLELANEIRTTAAVAYESQGSTAGAIEMLDDISGELTDSADDETVRELADNLFEKGRLLNLGFRYREAAVELERALALRKSSVTSRLRGLSGLELAWSRYSLGYPDRAAILIEESLPRVSPAGNTEIVFRAYDSAARINRQGGQFALMEQYREKQAVLAGSGRLKARYLFGRAMDARSRNGSASRAAQQILQQSRLAAQQSDDDITGHRSLMWLCLSRLERNGSDGCSAAEVRSSHAALRASGIPRVAAESRFVQAGILHRTGRTREALEAMGLLIDELRFFQVQFPGVLGAWYWENRTGIFSEYLSMTLSLSRSGAGGFADGRLTLLALERVRMLMDADVTGQSQQLQQDGQFADARTSLARLELSSGSDTDRLAGQLSQQFLGLFQDFVRDNESLDENTLDALLNGLGEQDSVLTYHFGEDAVHLLLGDSKGVRMLELGGAKQIRDRIGAFRNTMGLVQADSSLTDLEMLGTGLLEPVSGLIGDHVWFLPSGPLNGFPFDALRLNGRFFAQDHRLVNLTTLSAVARRNPQMRAVFSDRVFVGGNPQSEQELFSYGLSSTTEIAVVRDRFVGPGLHIVQGVALQRDEFLDERFANAALIHLAIPGSIDLAYPERSRLALSAAGNNELRDYLSPVDLQTLDLSADLAVLSGTATSGVGRSAFDSRQGFVSEFMESGVKSVVATLWSIGDNGTAAFMESFYAGLEPGTGVSEALARTRLERINSDPAMNFQSWAGFQLYIR